MGSELNEAYVLVKWWEKKPLEPTYLSLLKTVIQEMKIEIKEESKEIKIKSN